MIHFGSIRLDTLFFCNAIVLNEIIEYLCEGFKLNFATNIFLRSFLCLSKFEEDKKMFNKALKLSLWSAKWSLMVEFIFPPEWFEKWWLVRMKQWTIFHYDAVRLKAVLPWMDMPTCWLHLKCSTSNELFNKLQVFLQTFRPSVTRQQE